VPGDKKHVMYVWFDALVNYISCLGWPEHKNKFKDFWPGIQIAGKDNLRHQASMWQTMLFSAGLPRSKQIFIHGFITANGQKMSKSLGNVVNPIELAEKYSADALRYYLLREISPSEDGDFTLEKFEQRYNADLAGGLGNLVSRVITMASKRDLYLKAFNFKNIGLRKKIKNAEIKIDKNLKYFKYNEAIKEIWELISWCDKYINENKPWEEKKGSEKIILNLLFVLENISRLLSPFLQTLHKGLKIC